MALVNECKPRQGRLAARQPSEQQVILEMNGTSYRNEEAKQRAEATTASERRSTATDGEV